MANLVVAAVGSDGSVDLYNGSGGTIQLIADISGWFPAGYPIRAGGLDAMSPARLLDTRVGLGATGPVPPGATVKLADPNASSEPPTGVATVALNVTVTQPTRAGWVSVFPDGTPRPATSNVNFAAGATVASLVVSAVGTDGTVDVYNGSGGTIQLIADISGWFPGGYPLAPGGISPINPARLLDTRVGLGATGPVPPGATVKLAATNAPNEPSGEVGVVALNVTVTQPTRAGWVSVFPDGTPRPATSNVNFAAGATVANLVVVVVGSDGSVDLYNGSGGTIQMIADIPAWFFLSS